MAILFSACASPAVVEQAEAALVGNPLKNLEEVPRERFAGTIQETLKAGPYSYAHIALCDGGERWVVGLSKGASIGDGVSVLPVGIAREFESGRTARTFDELWFGVLRVEGSNCSAQAAKG